jgi:hypothetical protein
MVKFLDLSEAPSSPMSTAVTAAMCDGTVLLTLKEDGSLIIRSVWKGTVILRTRGHHELGNFEPLVLPLIEERFPRLLDPSLHPELDIHLEFVSPSARIVVAYNEPEMILVHAKERATHRLLSWDELGDLSEEIGVRRVGVVEGMAVRTPKELQVLLSAAETNGSWDREGIVARDPATGFMVKIKGDRFRWLHRMITETRYSDVVRICDEEGISSLEALRANLAEKGLDIDRVPAIEEWFGIYRGRVGEFEEMLEGAKSFVAAWEGGSDSRKEFAAAVKGRPDAGLLFALMDGKTERTIPKFRKAIVDAKVEGNAWTVIGPEDV